MFNLKTASIGLRKAAYLQGIRKGKWSPINDSLNVAKVVSENGKKEVVIDRAEIDCANDLNWSEIK